MKNQILISIALVIFAGTGAIAQSPKQKYTCVMHPEVVMGAPGKCPKCGMTLVPMKDEGKRPTSNVQRPTSNEEESYATRDSSRKTATHEMHSVHSEKKEEMHDMQRQQMSMHSSVNVAEPMSRESSGTSWVPDSTPMYARMLMFGDDMLMLHGGIFPRYVNANTRRGDDRVDGPNWFMAMYSHPLGENTQIGFRGMMSLDLLTEGGRGYPLLFQTGETWNGDPLHDRQHPHDLFDEISLSLSQKFARDLSA
jgi:hypothetical protein